jgi:hypothetical protein
LISTFELRGERKDYIGLEFKAKRNAECDAKGFGKDRKGFVPEGDVAPVKMKATATGV